MRIVHLKLGDRECAASVEEEIERLLGNGKHVAVTVAVEDETLSPAANDGPARIFPPARGQADRRGRAPRAEDGRLDLLADPARVRARV
jgi:hypothetical protein